MPDNFETFRKWSIPTEKQWISIILYTADFAPSSFTFKGTVVLLVNNMYAELKEVLNKLGFKNIVSTPTQLDEQDIVFYYYDATGSLYTIKDHFVDVNYLSFGFVVDLIQKLFKRGSLDFDPNLYSNHYQEMLEYHEQVLSKRRRRIEAVGIRNGDTIHEDEDEEEEEQGEDEDEEEEEDKNIIDNENEEDIINDEDGDNKNNGDRLLYYCYCFPFINFLFFFSTKTIRQLRCGQRNQYRIACK